VASLELAADPLLADSLADLAADARELRFLAAHGSDRLADLDAELRRGVLPSTRQAVLAQARALAGRYDEILAELEAVSSLVARAASPSELASAECSLRALADVVRSLAGVQAALVTSTDWQSPSFAHAVSPAAGRQVGLIEPCWTDYKRDRHLDAAGYEAAWLAEYVDGPPDRPVHAFMTSCGMSALTTILAFLTGEARVRRVLAGRALYHETKWLLARHFAGDVIWVDEESAAEVVAAIRSHRPDAILLDSLSNTSRAVMPDLERIAHEAGETWLVVDNTALACTFQALRLGAANTLVFESLLKYAQFGLDRANAGMIVASGDGVERLSTYREHLGTNITDWAVHALPPPDRARLEARLARIERNARALAVRLPGAVHPSLAGHPSAAVAARRRFAGGCLALALASGRERFTRVAVEEAARRGVELIAGSSFGFATTRIYVTASQAEWGTPFVRIAAGTEHRLTVETLGDAFAAALRRVNYRPRAG
jgi:cystathionine beta-lyase/cystathionine gamma-synthase